MATKILVIKMGYSETLDPEIGRIPSLGDVLRTTPILWAVREKFANSHVTWLVSRQAEPLLHGSELIDRLLVWDEFVPFQLTREKFDILINLEKIPGVCALADMIDAWTKYGFRFDSVLGTYHAYEKGMSFIEYLKGKQYNKKSKDFWQKILIEMLGVEWKGQEYVIGYKPQTKEIYDVGLNHTSGPKWPTKMMPMEKWKELEAGLTGKGYKVSWQKGLSNLNEYMDWVNSCRILISQDSLCIHMALALRKKIVGLFGPTDPQEIYSYGNARIVQPRHKCEFMPCYNPSCLGELNCMDKIAVDDVVEAIGDFK
jgi:heptosyltransferase-2